jgi:hypothetical protein
MIESIVSTPVRVAKGRRFGAFEVRRRGPFRRELPPHGRISHILARNEATQFCQCDYESFTDSWLAADMTPGRRIRAMTDYLRSPNPWDDPQMTDSPA